MGIKFKAYCAAKALVFFGGSSSSATGTLVANLQSIKNSLPDGSVDMFTELESRLG